MWTDIQETELALLKHRKTPQDAAKTPQMRVWQWVRGQQWGYMVSVKPCFRVKIASEIK